MASRGQIYGGWTLIEVLYSPPNVTESGSSLIPVVASSAVRSLTFSLQNTRWIFKQFLPVTESH